MYIYIYIYTYILMMYTYVSWPPAQARKPGRGQFASREVIKKKNEKMYVYIYICMYTHNNHIYLL